MCRTGVGTFYLLRRPTIDRGPMDDPSPTPSNVGVAGRSSRRGAAIEGGTLIAYNAGQPSGMRVRPLALEHAPRIMRAKGHSA
jgi:hypothetical protein